MKLVFAFVFVFLINSVYAQQVFQGSIAYALHVPQEKNDAELLIQYGTNKIKVKFKEKADFDKTYLLIDLDSSKFFIINNDEKTFQVKKLSEKTSAENLPAKTIAGHITTPVSISASAGLSSIFGASGTTVLFPASDLYFPVPKKHAGIPELTMIQNDHIVLGADISMGSPGMSEKLPDSILQQMKVSVEATKITSQVFDAAEFSIPADFKEKSQFSDMITDSTAYNPDLDSIAMMTDTALVVTPPKINKQPKSKPSTPKKTTPTKTEAIKPKKTQTKS